MLCNREILNYGIIMANFKKKKKKKKKGLQIRETLK